MWARNFGLILLSVLVPLWVVASLGGRAATQLNHESRLWVPELFPHFFPCWIRTGKKWFQPAHDFSSRPELHPLFNFCIFHETLEGVWEVPVGRRQREQKTRPISTTLYQRVGEPKILNKKPLRRSSPCRPSWRLSWPGPNDKETLLSYTDNTNAHTQTDTHKHTQNPHIPCPRSPRSPWPGPGSARRWTRPSRGPFCFVCFCMHFLRKVEILGNERGATQGKQTGIFEHRAFLGFALMPPSKFPSPVFFPGKFWNGYSDQ